MDQHFEVVSSNHISIIDGIMLGCLYYPVFFVIKDDILKIPFLNTLCKTNGCLFINRQQKDRGAIYQQLKEYVAKNGKNGNKLIMFPEGTTTNGDYILNLKKGVFTLNSKLLILRISYGGLCREGFNGTPILDNLLLYFLQFDGTISIKELEVVDSKEENLSYCRELYLKDGLLDKPIFLEELLKIDAEFKSVLHSTKDKEA